ncbi:uncharacterized protein LOC123512090 [Portunus trituberculatus]|nr:uncharacterized protein LOC123512090 [Portunus trituberculatus]
MRGTLTVVAVVVVSVAAAWAAQLPNRQEGGALDAFQALHEAALAGTLSSGEVPYPSRPNVFKSKGELRRYLDALNAYFAIAGRPRFGKRGEQVRQPEELYDY